MDNKIDLETRTKFEQSLGQKCEDFIFEADHIYEFDVEWIDENQNKQINKGYRVQWNNLNGPYKGGLRFHPNVSLDLFKKLAFEQTFKNVLTGLPMGGAKGGSDFDPHGKSENDIKSFCYAFMEKLAPYIGEEVDIPAGDIGVGGREIKYLYEAYKKITGKSDCSLTGKPIEMGGSLCRKEATGFGLCYITNALLKSVKNTSFKDKIVVISGSGNVAIYAASKAIELGAKVVAMSDSNNCIYDQNGINLDLIKEIKEIKRGRIKEYKEYKNDSTLLSSSDIWSIKADIVLPCATQNEIDEKEAELIVKNNTICVCEGSNLSCTKEAVKILKENNILYIPGKASNAGGVSVSGLEIKQAKEKTSYSFEKVDSLLKEIMENIFKNIYEVSRLNNKENDFVYGSNKFAYDKLVELKHSK